MVVPKNGYRNSSPRETGEMDVFIVPIRSLLRGPSPRINGEDERHVKLLAQMGKSLPPILVQRATMRVIDGMHRLRAADLRGETEIAVRFFDGNDAHAFIAAIKANAEHGLPLTLADREAAASRIITQSPDRSDRSIAGLTGLAPGTVSALRRRTRGDDDLATRRMGRDGRVRPVNGAEGRRRAMEAIAKKPKASLREVAKIAGVSPGTVRDVRRRMALGEAMPSPPTRSDAGSSEQKTASGPARQKRKATLPRPGTRDRSELLMRLRRDPSLRLSETGRELLHWLDVHTREKDELVNLAEAIPPHCAYAIAELALYCADEWQKAANLLQQRCEDASGLLEGSGEDRVTVTRPGDRGDRDAVHVCNCLGWTVDHGRPLCMHRESPHRDVLPVAFSDCGGLTPGSREMSSAASSPVAGSYKTDAAPIVLDVSFRKMRLSCLT